MLVFADRVRRQSAAEKLAAIAAALERARDLVGIERHDALTLAFIEAGELVQGLEDARFDEAGCDDLRPEDPARGLLRALARSLAASWDHDFRHTADIPIPRVQEAHTDLVVRTPEGYAFYAVYPEAYLEAARRARLAAPPLVIGVRSIGSGLSAMAAEATGGEVATVRPVGDPYERRLRIGPSLAKAMGSAAAALIVDEGPGLSGSSFAAVDRVLDDCGMSGRRVYLPSHLGEPGAAAPPARRAWWRGVERRVVEFEDLHRGGEPPSWFADLIGEAVEPVKDLSAGRWREEKKNLGAVPAYPSLERRKLLVRTASGDWLLKYAGLGRHGAGKLARARALHEAGFCPEPLGIRRGFMAWRWIAEARSPAHGPPPSIAEYLAFRARAFPAAEDEGAGIAELTGMAERNTGLLLGPAAGRAISRRLSRCGQDLPIVRVHVDGRMHRWEWLEAADGRWLKTDAVDHSEGHDLIGAQDIAWDVAGVAVEFELSDAGRERLRIEVQQRAGRPVDERLTAFYGLAYLAFQGGLWALAAQSVSGAEQASALAASRRYAERLGSLI